MVRQICGYCNKLIEFNTPVRRCIKGVITDKYHNDSEEWSDPIFKSEGPPGFQTLTDIHGKCWDKIMGVNQE